MPLLLTLLLLFFLPSPLHSFPASPDFLIIGAGTSGCALAARLCTLLPTHTVLLLERAPPRTPSENFLVRSPRQMWNAWNPRSPVIQSFSSVPNSGLNNRTIRVFTGHTLGGSSAINGMQFVVPFQTAVDSWRIDGLTTNSSRRLFRRVFRKVGFAPQVGALRHRYAAGYIRAARRAGYRADPDPLDGTDERNMYENRLAVDGKGRRVDSCTAYLEPVRDSVCRGNLRLLQGVTVSRVLLSESRRATGVEYVNTVEGEGGVRKTLSAKREVIVAAGPFGSPQLLQLSGIGPPDVLKNAGVELRVALPVGRRTQSRNFVSVASLYTGVPLEPSNNSTLLESQEAREMFRRGKGGVLGIASFFANGRDRRDAYLTGAGSFASEVVDVPIIASNCNGNVKSFGSLRIRDASPFTDPEVQLALLSKPGDVRRLQRCLRRLVKIHQNFPAQWNSTIIDPPGGNVTEEFIRSNAGWAGHFVGGCNVGGVLDGELRVRSTTRLRVVDSSSLRTIPDSAGPMASTYVLAEHIAEIIAAAADVDISRKGS